MKSKFIRFNSILTLCLGLAVTGCETTKAKDSAKSTKPTKEEKAARAAEAKAEKEKKAKQVKVDKKLMAMLAFHLETSTSAGQVASVPIAGQYLSMEPAPFLDLGSVESVEVVDDALGGFFLKVKFDAHGTFQLDNITSANKGRKIGVWATFNQQKKQELKDVWNRWLAAPIIQRRNEAGVLTFTPNATREETERLVAGIRNSLAEMRKVWK